MYDEIVKFIKVVMSTLIQSRYAALAATALIYLIVITMRGIRLIVVNKKKVSKMEFEIKEWEERKRKAVELRDRKLFEKVMKEKPRINKLKTDLGIERLKSTLASIVLWFTMFKVLWDAIGTAPVGLIALPTGYVEIPFYAWYILNSFWSGFIVDRLLGLFKKSE